MQAHAPAAARGAVRNHCTRTISTFRKGISMKKLMTMVFAGCMAVSMSGAFAADNMAKDGMMKKDEMKKDSMAKDGMMKKDEMKKDAMAKDGMAKDGMKK
jgi:pentapeptide MXKDX repeat protein